MILPQAVRNVVPPLLNDFIALQKDTALVAVLGPLEALRVAQIDSDYDFNYTPYLACGGAVHRGDHPDDPVRGPAAAARRAAAAGGATR